MDAANDFGLQLKAAWGEQSSIEPFSMDLSPFGKQVGPWLPICFSRTLLLFHGVIIVVILIVLLTLKAG